MIKRIKDGEIGKVQFFRVYWNSGGVWNRKRKPGQTEMEYQMRNWYYFNWLCGDHITEQHVHNIDIANWVMGTHPVEANGMGGRQVRKFGTNGDFGQSYDHHFVEFTYADRTKMFSQCRHIPHCWSSVAEYAHGVDGYANISRARLYNFTNDTKVSFREKFRNPRDQQHADLMDAIRNDKPFNQGYVGADSSFTAVLGRMATYSGKVVKWDDAVANGPSEMPETFAFDATPPVIPDEKGSYEAFVAMPGIYKPY